MISHFFIDRPIFASVLSIVIVVIGLVALRALPIAQFPEITPPVVQIEADYPGANAEIVADSVARPIEVQLPGIDNLLYYDSTSTNDGHMSHQADVRDRHRRRHRSSPNAESGEARRTATSSGSRAPGHQHHESLAGSAGGRGAEFDRSDPRYRLLSNYAILRVVDNLKRLHGVGNAIVFGSAKLFDAADPGSDQDGASSASRRRTFRASSVSRTEIFLPGRSAVNRP